MRTHSPQHLLPPPPRRVAAGPVECHRCGETWPQGDPALGLDCPTCDAPAGSPCCRPRGGNQDVCIARDLQAVRLGLLRPCPALTWDGRHAKPLPLVCAPNDTVWTEGTIARLRALWAERHSTAEIGRHLGVSKNAVVGKAHRLQLPQRPNPIQRGGASTGTPRSTAPRRTQKSSLLPPRRAPRSCRQPLPASQLRDRCGGECRPVPPVTAAAMPPKLGSKPCCWPLGEPSRPGFRFCGAPAVQSKPYCPAHDDLAHVRPRASRSSVLPGGFDPYA